MYKRNENIRLVEADYAFNEELKRQSEKKYERELKEMGKISAFKEYFEAQPLDEQELSIIPEVGDIKSNKDFLEGRKFGFSLIEHGFNITNYEEYMNNPSKKRR